MSELLDNIQFEADEFDRYFDHIIADPDLIQAIGQHWTDVVSKSSGLRSLAEIAAKEIQDGKPLDGAMLSFAAKMVAIGYNVGLKRKREVN